MWKIPTRSHLKLRVPTRINLITNRWSIANGILGKHSSKIAFEPNYPQRGVWKVKNALRQKRFWQEIGASGQTIAAARLPASDFKVLDYWRPNCILTSGMLDPVSGQLERYMDLLSARQKLVASNIANADTPDIDFQSEFQNALGGPPQVIQISGLPTKNDGNNVSLDRESRLLSENALRFNVATNLLRSQISQVRSAIKEGQGS